MPRASFVDMLGQTVNGWAIKERAKSHSKGATWWCSCIDCGAQRLIAGTVLRKPRKVGRCRKCHPVRVRGRKRIDITGQTHGTWRVLARVVSSRVRWRCSCITCDFERDVDGSHLIAEPPPCTECKKEAARVATKPAELQRSTRVVMPFDSEEQGVSARCSACRSMALFLRGRCGICGSRRADVLPHVDGRRSA